MTFNPDERERRSTRLPTYDYSLAGAYFVTICAHNRTCIFADIADGEIRLNDLGRVVTECWNEIPRHFPGVELDVFAVMPNHLHGIAMLPRDEWCTEVNDNTGRGKACLAPTPRRFGTPPPNSLSSIIGSFKSAASRRINILRRTPGAPVWQRNYYEHVIRNREDLHEVQQYILDNPLRWAMDNENPDARRPPDRTRPIGKTT